MERGVRRQERVRAAEDIGERVDLGERAVGGCVHVREVQHRTDPGNTLRDREHVVDRPELPHPAHDLDPERHAAALLLQALTQLPRLLDDIVERLLALSPEQKPGVEHDHLRARGERDPCGVVEHADRHVQLLAALRVPDEARDRRVDGEDDARVPRELSKPLRPRVVHPELALEVDLAGRIAAFLEERDRLFRRFARRDARRPESKLAHALTVNHNAWRPMPFLP